MSATTSATTAPAARRSPRRFVSGLASLMIANDPSLTNTQVMNIIKSTARDVGTPGVDQFTGYGIIDARRH